MKAWVWSWIEKTNTSLSRIDDIQSYKTAQYHSSRPSGSIIWLTHIGACQLIKINNAPRRVFRGTMTHVWACRAAILERQTAAAVSPCLNQHWEFGFCDNRPTRHKIQVIRRENVKPLQWLRIDPLRLNQVLRVMEGMLTQLPVQYSYCTMSHWDLEPSTLLSHSTTMLNFSAMDQTKLLLLFIFYPLGTKFPRVKYWRLSK